MQKIQDRSLPNEAFDWSREFQLFLIIILLGVGRAKRGELLIAGQFVRTFALRTIVGMIKQRRLPKTGTEGLADNLEILRRFEIQYPIEAALIEGACQHSVEIAGLKMLEILEGLLPISKVERAQISVVRDRLK
jgi:hypothetical protein